MLAMYNVGYKRTLCRVAHTEQCPRPHAHQMHSISLTFQIVPAHVESLVRHNFPESSRRYTSIVVDSCHLQHAGSLQHRLSKHLIIDEPSRDLRLQGRLDDLTDVGMRLTLTEQKQKASVDVTIFPTPGTIDFVPSSSL